MLMYKKLSALLIEITSKHNDDLYYLSCFHSTTKNKLESHEKEFKKKYFCGIVWPTQKSNILGFNQ